MIWRTGVRFVFLIMGDFDSNIDKAAIHDGSAQIIGVSDMQQAIEGKPAGLRRKVLAALSSAVRSVRRMLAES